MSCDILYPLALRITSLFFNPALLRGAEQAAKAGVKRFGKRYGGAGEKKKTFPQKGFSSPPRYHAPPPSFFIKIFADGIAGGFQCFCGFAQVVVVFLVNVFHVQPDGGFEIVGDIVMCFGGEIFHHLFMFGEEFGEIGFGEDAGAFEEVAEFADVAGVIVGF